MAEEVKRLRAAAKIGYVGEFAKLEQEVPVTDGAGAPKSASAAGQVLQSTSAARGNIDEDAMAKGVKGLK